MNRKERNASTLVYKWYDFLNWKYIILSYNTFWLKCYYEMDDIDSFVYVKVSLNLWGEADVIAKGDLWYAIEFYWKNLVTFYWELVLLCT